MPKVSVIMSVYNTEEYLKESIESILNQDFSDFELIILDDFSSDNSFQICKSYEKIDKRIKLFRNNENKGISFTRNKLISLCSTNYICTQDSDDVSFEKRISILYNFLENNNDYAVVSANMKIIDENSKIIGERIYKNNLEKIILKKSPISNPASIFRKDLFLQVGGYDKNLDYAEDYDLWLRFFSKGYKIKLIDDFVLKYRIRKEQTKSKKLKQTLKNTTFVQKKAIEKYGLKATFGDKVYHLFEKILLFLPDKFILFLFKKLEYDKK